MRTDLTRRILGFSLLPLSTAITSLIVLGVVARYATVHEWAAIAVGQATGGVAGVAASYGWNVTGPAEIARSQSDPKNLLAESIVVRLVTVALATGPVVGLASLIVEGPDMLASAMAVASLTGALAMNWYAVGCGEPKIQVTYEVLPRSAGNLVASGLVLATGSVMLYPLAVVSGGVIGLLAFGHAHIGQRPFLTVTRKVVAARLRTNARAATAELSAAAYTVSASALVGILGSPSTVAVFNAGERLIKLGAHGILILSNAMQGWVAAASGTQFLRRASLSMCAQVSLGLMGLALMFWLGPLATGALFGERLAIDRVTAALLGWFFLMWAIETVTGRHILAGRHRTKPLLVSSLTGTCVGIPVIIIASDWYGPAGAALGLAVAHTGVVVFQLVPAWRVIRLEKESSR